MTQDDRWSRVDDYITGVFGLSDAALEATLKSTADAGMPDIQVAPNQGALLFLLARMVKAQRILEVGTLAGYSTIWLARALPDGGRVITLELERKHADVARANIARAGLDDKVEIRVGPALDSLKRLDGSFDLIFIDADKTGYPAYLEQSLRLSRSGTVIVADNVVRDGKIADANSDDAAVQAVRRFNEMLAKQASATIVQTVGMKGYDGLAIAIV